MLAIKLSDQAWVQAIWKVCITLCESPWLLRSSEEALLSTPPPSQTHLVRGPSWQPLLGFVMQCPEKEPGWPPPHFSSTGSIWISISGTILCSYVDGVPKSWLLAKQAIPNVLLITNYTDILLSPPQWAQDGTQPSPSLPLFSQTICGKGLTERECKWHIVAHWISWLTMNLNLALPCPSPIV